MAVRMIGTGSYLPDRVLTNQEIERRGAYDPAAHGGQSLHEWAVSHHGGETRHVAAAAEATSTLATRAAVRALADARLDIEEIEVIVLSTFTGDHRLPQAAGQVQGNLRSHAKFVQLDAACTGFIDGLLVAQGLMETHGYRCALVLAADVLTLLSAPTDWLAQTVFGDAAGGVVLARDDDHGFGIMAHCTGSDGHLGDYVFVPAGGSRQPITHGTLDAGLQYWRLQFSEISTWAANRMVYATEHVLKQVGIGIGDVRLIVPHQASGRIVHKFAAAVGCPPERIVSTYPRIGNVSGASIPVSLDLIGIRDRLRTGDWLLMPAVGAGMAWGAIAYRWRAG